ncbi:hypothetical protein M6B38_182685 [Iris pallida]|uniref:Uncharacterized protein n=1 Tax=Iris pallida TaxID=29817 RepID=A0AAX6ELL6_IRIPA|nr:hypothetical protein M6B38_182685 [Iris pallida]
MVVAMAMYGAVTGDAGVGESAGLWWSWRVGGACGWSYGVSDTRNSYTVIL